MRMFSSPISPRRGKTISTRSSTSSPPFRYLACFEICGRKKLGNYSSFKPHLKRYWTIPAKQNGDFVATMEDVLDLYAQPHDSLRPVLCMEKPMTTNNGWIWLKQDGPMP
jgi:hypothetical protein